MDFCKQCIPVLFCDFYRYVAIKEELEKQRWGELTTTNYSGEFTMNNLNIKLALFKRAYSKAYDLCAFCKTDLSFAFKSNKSEALMREKCHIFGFIRNSVPSSFTARLKWFATPETW